MTFPFSGQRGHAPLSCTQREAFWQACVCSTCSISLKEGSLLGTQSNEFMSVQISKSKNWVQSHLIFSASVNPCCKEWVGRGGNPARQEGGIPLHQEDWEAYDGLAPGLTLILSQVSCQGWGQLFQLCCWSFIPASERLYHDGEEGNALGLYLKYWQWPCAPQCAGTMYDASPLNI